jgi:hypothetical protein
MIKREQCETIERMSSVEVVQMKKVQGGQLILFVLRSRYCITIEKTLRL